MVVKEMRQGLRTRFFSVALILFHVMLGLLMLGFLFEVRPKDAHEMFWVIIITTLLGVLPARAWNTLHSEAKDGTLDMLVLTGMSSFRIVWGKWVSLYSQTLLVTSSLLPYMIARYQLGGVEIVRELVGLYLLILGSAIITAAMVAFSSQSLMMIRLLFSALVGLMAYGIGAFTFLVSIKFDQDKMFENLIPDDFVDIAMLGAGLCCLSAYLIYVMLCIGSARLPRIIDSQGTIKRIVALILFTLLASAVWGMNMYELRFSRFPLEATLTILTCLTLFIGMDVLTEHAAPPYLRYSNGIKQARPFSWLTFIFFSGWPSGVFFYLLISLLPFYAQLAISRSYSSVGDIESLCIVCCVLVINLIPVCVIFYQKKSRLSHWLGVQLIIFAIGFIFQSIVRSIYYEEGRNLAFLMMLSPVTVLLEVNRSTFRRQDEIVEIGSLLSLLWVLAAMLLAIREINRLRALAISSDTTPSPTDAKLS